MDKLMPPFRIVIMFQESTDPCRILIMFQESTDPCRIVTMPQESTDQYRTATSAMIYRFSPPEQIKLIKVYQ